MKARNEVLAGPIEWLLGTRVPLSPSIRSQLQEGLFASLPIFLGGIVNSIAIAALAAWRHPTAPFLIWLSLEVAIGLVRLPILVHGRSARRAGRNSGRPRGKAGGSVQRRGRLVQGSSGPGPHDPREAGG